MGRPKMLFPWKNTSVLGHVISSWSHMSAGQIAVVCAANDAAINVELDSLKFPRQNRIVNPDSSRGMFSSVQCVAGWSGGQASLTHWAIVLGDQPHLRPGTLEALINFAAQHPGKICQPAHQSHARHPVFLPKMEFMRLPGSNAGTLKEFLQSLSAQPALIELNDPGLELDLDIPADYEKALQLLPPSERNLSC